VRETTSFPFREIVRFCGEVYFNNVLMSQESDHNVEDRSARQPIRNVPDLNMQALLWEMERLLDRRLNPIKDHLFQVETNGDMNRLGESRVVCEFARSSMRKYRLVCSKKMFLNKLCGSYSRGSNEGFKIWILRFRFKVNERMERRNSKASTNLY